MVHAVSVLIQAFNQSTVSLRSCYTVANHIYTEKSCVKRSKGEVFRSHFLLCEIISNHWTELDWMPHLHLPSIHIHPSESFWEPLTRPKDMVPVGIWDSAHVPGRLPGSQMLTKLQFTRKVRRRLCSFVASYQTLPTAVHRNRLGTKLHFLLGFAWESKANTSSVSTSPRSPYGPYGS